VRINGVEKGRVLQEVSVAITLVKGGLFFFSFFFFLFFLPSLLSFLPQVLRRRRWGREEPAEEEEEEESKDKWTRDPAGVKEQAGGGTVPVPHVILGREIIVCR